MLTGKAIIMPFLILRLFAREMIRRLRKGAQVEEVYLGPFRGKDYRHKTVCHTGEAGVLRFCLQSLGDAGKEAIQIKDRCGFLTEAILSN